MKNLKKVSKGINTILVNMMVKCMLNPDNKDFYLGNLSLEKVEHFFKTMPQDDEVADVFWSAYSIAEPKYLEEKRRVEEGYIFADSKLQSILSETPIWHICPECGCRDYVSGVACPNCDYVDED